MKRWPWQPRPTVRHHLAVASGADRFAYALAAADGSLQRCGLELRGGDTAADFHRRLRALDLPDAAVSALLPLAESQLLQVEAPAVRPEEMKAAARWRIKDLIEGRLDELALDVMFVGDQRPRPNRQIFVAAARNEHVDATAERCAAAGLELAVIEIAETAQRNLQSALAEADGLGGRATAALVRHGDECLLTIAAAGELFYARRLPWDGLALPGSGPLPAPAATAARPAGAVPAIAELALESADFIDYGAEPEPGAGAEPEAPRLVIGLQRSFDVWERTWPDLPLAALWVQVGDSSTALAGLLQAHLGRRVGVLDAGRLFPGLAGRAPTASVRDAVLPLLGALLRHRA